MLISILINDYKTDCTTFKDETMKKVILILISIFTVACSITNAQNNQGFPNTITGQYLLGGDYYLSCNYPNVSINTLSGTTGTLTALCGYGTSNINFSSCYVDSQNWIEVINDDMALWCDNSEPFVKLQAVSNSAIAGDYWENCNSANVTYARYTGNIYVPQSMTAICTGTQSSLNIIGNCQLNANGYYFVTSNNGQLECANKKD